MLIRIKKGLDLPVAGAPVQVIESAKAVQSVALTGQDYPGLKPRLQVREGQRVKLGEVLFTDKRSGVSYTAAGSGTVSHIHRGYRRSLESVVIQLDGNDEETFSAYRSDQLAGLSADTIRQQLQLSGLWSALRTRPFNKPPSITGRGPGALFVTAMDSRPMAADPVFVIDNYRQDFIDGLTVISRLAEVPVFVCKAAAADIPVPDHSNIKTVEFSGPHPAGLAGTHIDLLFPVDLDRCAWQVNYQDTIAIGKLFSTGRLWPERIISLAGPQVQRPRLIRSRVGANIQDLVDGELKTGENRVVSGCLLSGRQVNQEHAWLGRYHLQISVIEEHNKLLPSSGRAFSINALSSGRPDHRHAYRFTSAMHGRQRPLIPIGNFEKVMPLDILPTPLLKSLLVEDLEMAQALGCLGLDEEDLSLCSFVCCSKIDYSAALRQCLPRIEDQL